MRITYLHQYFNTPDMSGGTRSYEMARRLVAKGHEVNMVTSWREDDGRRDWFETEEAGIRVHWLPVPYSNNMGFQERIRAFLRFAWGAARKAASLPADVVFATSTPLTIALTGAYAAWRQKAPMVFEVRDLWPDVPIAMGALNNPVLQYSAKKLEKWAYSKSKKIVALTPTMRDFISGKGVELEKIHILPNGATVFPFTPLDIKNGQNSFSILYCGNLGPAHGVDYLCHLARAVKDKEYPIHIKVAGEGKETKRLQETAFNDNTINNAISFIGKVSKTQIPELYSQADASIMTICNCELLYRHAVQNKFFESLMAGCPVFANYRGWASELAEHEEVGAILPYNDSDAAVDILWSKLNSATWMNEASIKSRRIAEKRFSFDILASKLEAILKDVTKCQ